MLRREADLEYAILVFVEMQVMKIIQTLINGQDVELVLMIDPQIISGDRRPVRRC